MRQIGVSYSGFVDESYTLLSLFDDVEQIEKDNRLQTAIDVVREQFGFLAIQNILRLVVKKSPTGVSTHCFFFMLK